MVHEKTRVTRISIDRLKNLGNYEHIKYSVTVDINPNDSAAAVMRNLEAALNDMARPRPSSLYTVVRAKETLAKHAGEALPPTSIEFGDVTSAKEILDQTTAWEETQKHARDFLDAIGLSEKYTDHKENWDQDDH